MSTQVKGYTQAKWWSTLRSGLTAVAKVVFLCGESLLPVVGIALLDTISSLSFENSVAIILCVGSHSSPSCLGPDASSRVCVQLEPLLYFHGLMSALVS